MKEKGGGKKRHELSLGETILGYPTIKNYFMSVSIWIEKYTKEKGKS